MERFFQRFVNEEKGSVAIDWIVLTAGCVGLGIALLAALTSHEDMASSDTAPATAPASVQIDAV